MADSPHADPHFDAKGHCACTCEHCYTRWTDPDGKWSMAKPGFCSCPDCICGEE